MSWSEEVAACLQPIPLQLVPPVLLAVHHRRQLITSTTTVNGWQPPEAPAAPELDGLQRRSQHIGFTYMLQHGEIMEMDVSEAWEFYAVSRFSFVRFPLWENLCELATACDVDGFQASHGGEGPGEYKSEPGAGVQVYIP